MTNLPDSVVVIFGIVVVICVAGGVVSFGWEVVETFRVRKRRRASRD
jgi:hypothetical protein